MYINATVKGLSIIKAKFNQLMLGLSMCFIY